MNDTVNLIFGRRTALKMAGGFTAFTVLFPAASMSTEAKDRGGKILVAFFSATGTTARIAKKIPPVALGNISELAKSPYQQGFPFAPPFFCVALLSDATLFAHSQAHHSGTLI